MQVTIRVGETEETFEVDSDLLSPPPGPYNDQRQDIVMENVGHHFVVAYKREIERAANDIGPDYDWCPIHRSNNCNPFTHLTKSG